MASEYPTLPSPPFHDVPGIFNFRDLGGYSVQPSGSVRSNFIFRSALPTKITAAGCDKLVSELHISHIYDLRSDLEVDRDPSSTITGVDRHHVPVSALKDASPEAMALSIKPYLSTDGSKGYVTAYSEIFLSGATAYRRLFGHVRDRPDEPFLVHCTAGKDRTGCFGALALRLAGVEDLDVIGKEYGLTDLGLAPLKKMMAAKVTEATKLNDPAGVERLLASDPENMKASMLWLEEKYGNVEGYFKSVLGFSDEDILRIRSNLVVQGDI
ncbi:hypothetical protein N7520_003779 [Penicillium odoratum]|uniref:uncharacterized protein n=1 Tax=Penicillium odoratum TaxID=1167516 RepID=UPI002548C063|nr:uncharacterized protein N7520_003779 [Penicillium odoratum]KAJ5769220.1 hypothetical protein N7520_003779 [Penicillium odoratum]